VQKLHLVGTTTDNAGLILSARRGARSGSYTLVLDDALARAVEELRARQEEEGTADGRAGRAPRTESNLPIGEIQARLRRGKSVKDVAKDAGVEPEWIERFAAPVFAEQAETIAKVQTTFLRRARLGPSGMRVGDAVRRNLAERAVVMSPDEYNRAWTTHQRPDGRWLVRFAFHYRGSAKTLKYEVRPNGEVSASDAFTSQLSYITPPKRPTPRPKPLPEAADTSAKRAVVSTGFRPDSTAKPTSRPAKERERAAAIMTKAAQKRAAEGEKAAARKAKERARLMAQREREARIEAQRREREAAKRAREAAAAARLAAAEQAQRDKKAALEAAARQAERESARRAARVKVKAEARAVAAKKAAATKVAAKKSADARSAAVAKVRGKAAATKAPVSKAPAAKAPAAKVAKAPVATAPAKVTSRPVAKTRSERFAEARGEPAPAASKAASRPRPDRPSPSDRVAAAPPKRAAAKRPAPSAADVVESAPPRRASTTGLSGAAVDVYGPEASRALFRAGLAQPAGGTPARPAADEPTTQPTASVRAVRADDAAPAPRPRPRPANGAAQQRPPGARRTRPLRAN
jgi:hypothetical protein